MSPLKDRQKQLLFDYCIGLTSEKQTAEAEDLISSNDEAAEIQSKLKAALTPLDSIKPATCPDDLAQRTILRLNNLARSSQIQLEQLLARRTGQKRRHKGTVLAEDGQNCHGRCRVHDRMGNFSDFCKLRPSSLPAESMSGPNGQYISRLG
jgi:hypothetical protein